MASFEKFKLALRYLSQESKQFSEITKPYGIPGGPNVYTVSNLARVLNSYDIEKDEDITLAIEYIMDDLSLSELINIISNTNRLKLNYVSKTHIEKLEHILINEAMERKAHARLKRLYSNKELNPICIEYMNNNCLDTFFKSTNNVKDMITLFMSVLKKGDYSNEHFNKFYKILSTKPDNFSSAFFEKELMEELLKMKSHIKTEHKEQFEALLLLLKIS